MFNASPGESFTPSQLKKKIKAGLHKIAGCLYNESYSIWGFALGSPYLS